LRSKACVTLAAGWSWSTRSTRRPPLSIADTASRRAPAVRIGS
jgi:hypothetical protein